MLRSQCARSVRKALMASARTPLSRGLATEEPLKRTKLYDLHRELGGKMVPFAGYELPVQYKEGVLASHLHTRAANSSSLFDVSHMGQLRWHGKDAIEFLETLVVGDIAALRPGEGTLSLITTEAGGIVDDTIITRFDNHVGMVVNGATKYGDIEHFNKYLGEFKKKGKDVSFEFFEDQQLVAIQGPGAAAALQKLASADLSQMNFMTAKVMTVAGVPNCLVTRCGYTGEDGFEVSLQPDKAVAITTAILEQPGVLPAGLGARDSLRLEAGLCLYGHDINTSTTPVEAALLWTIGKRRREDKRFNGAEVIVKQIQEKSWKTKRVGLFVEGAPAREGTKIFSADGSKQVGHVTSGTFSPCLKRPISMGYVAKEVSEIGAAVKVEVRGKLLPATVTKMPFVPASYYRVPGSK